MDTEVEARVIQYLRDGKALLEHWTVQVRACSDCKPLVEETEPYLNGLKTLLRDLDAAV